MNFIKLIQKISENKKNIILIFMFFVVFYLFSDVTFAEASTNTGNSFDDLKTKTSEIWNWLLTWISLLLALITYLSTIFLSPTWINGSLFWLNTYFKEIWILMSNVVYFIFAFILIWIAFMNIIWVNSDQYQLKQALPKFIVWVIIVPFSWFLVQFVLSISAVLTVASLSLPFDTFDEFSSSLKWVNIPKTCTLNLQWFSANKESGEKDNKQDGFVKCLEWSSNEVPITEIAWKWDAISSIFWIIAMYTYWILSLDSVDDVGQLDLDSVKTMWDLVVKIIFDLLFVVIYSLLMIVLWFVLMVRWIYIWIYMMLSPVFWLMFFFGKNSWWDWFFAKFNLKEFIALAMVPVYTMLALSFWLLFLFVVWTWIAWGNKVSTDNDVSLENDKIKVWQFTLEIKWAVSRDKNFTWFLEKIWWAWLWITWSLILKVFGIVVLWWSIMAAMRTSEITKTITEPVYNFGTQVWWIMKSLPWNIPIFPTGNGGMQSMNSLGALWTKAQTYFNNQWSDRATKFAKEYWLFWDTWDMQKSINNAKWITNSNETAPILENAFKEMNWDSNKLLKPQFKELLTEIAKNKDSWASKEFREYMNETLKDKKELSRDEVEKALRLLEDSNGNINLPYSSWKGNWTYSDLDKHIKGLKNWSNSDDWWDSSSTPSSWTWTNQPVTVNVNNNNKIDNINWLNLTEKQKEAIEWLNTKNFNKDNFIEELKKPNVLWDETMAKQIADAIPANKFADSSPSNIGTWNNAPDWGEASSSLGDGSDD